MKANELTEQELTAIEERAQNATEGPWQRPIGISFVTTELNSVVCETHPGTTQALRNLDFIAHARTDIPRLLAEVRRLRAKLRDMQPYADAFSSGSGDTSP